MKAIQFTAYGSPDVLDVVDIDAPHPGTGEIVVQVASAGINQLDTKIRSGAMASGSALSSPSGPASTTFYPATSSSAPDEAPSPNGRS